MANLYTRGEWYCQSCGTHNPHARLNCSNCDWPRLHVPVSGAREARPPLPAGPAPTERRPPAADGGGQRREGDWDCPECGKHCFAFRDRCLSCSCPRPQGQSQLVPRSGPSPVGVPVLAQGGKGKGDGYGGDKGDKGGKGGPPLPMDKGGKGILDKGGKGPEKGMKGGDKGGDKGGKGKDMAGGGPPRPEPRGPPGPEQFTDWDCWVCGMMNFKRRTECMQCSTPRDKALPKAGGGEARPGDWFCMNCQNVNFAYRDSCKSCSGSRAECSNERVMERINAEQQRGTVAGEPIRKRPRQ